jgi:DNA helicase-2/ATP-dependent DNA helicase PcrA
LHRIPYLIVHGHEFYQRKEIKDVFAYLHLLNNSADQVAFQRIINVPARKIGPATVDKLKQYALEHGLPMLESARRCGLNSALSKQAAVKVARFVALIDQLGEYRTLSSVQAIIERVVDITGYRKSLIEAGTEEGHERAANVDELIAAAAEFDQMHPDDGGLEAFLEASALVNDADDLESNGNAVSLMTLHAAKGLEFPCVFIVGLEDGLLPHERNLQSDGELEEERRLLFVGITRAEHELQLSRTLSRFRRGQSWNTIASRFLMELPRGEMDVAGPSAMEFYGADDQILDDLELDFEIEWKQPVAKDLAAKPAPAASRKLVTAAQLLEQDSANKELVERQPVDVFHTGMVVEHPEYGSGIVKSLSGKDNKRVAVVCFGDMERSFRLAHSPLKPLPKSK